VVERKRLRQRIKYIPSCSVVNNQRAAASYRTDQVSVLRRHGDNVDGSQEITGMYVHQSRQANEISQNLDPAVGESSEGKGAKHA
jgi:hypothetical protein